MKLSRNSKRIIMLAIDAAFCGILCFAATYFDRLAEFIPECFFHSRGLVCPSCGGTRALANLLRGDIFAALGYNIPITLFFIYAAIGFIILNASVFSARMSPKRTLARLTDYRLIIGFAIFYFLFGIARCLYYIYI